MSESVSHTLFGIHSQCMVEFTLKKKQTPYTLQSIYQYVSESPGQNTGQEKTRLKLDIESTYRCDFNPINAANITHCQNWPIFHSIKERYGHI